MQGMGVFNPEFYRRFRPFYPAETFAQLRENLVARGFEEPFVIGDIGCGTGHSAVSLLRSGVGAQIVGVDPDPQMIERARELSTQYDLDDRLKFLVGTAEASSLQAQSLDAVLVGSAFHWMDSGRSLAEFRRVLRPKGLVRIFEYQFPKALEHAELNEWIRRQFNQDWKAPNQVPRGNFAQVTRDFRVSADWIHLGEGQPSMVLELETEEVVGLILSQSRVLHYERTLPSHQLSDFRQGLERSIHELMMGRKLAFDFKLAWVEFGAV